MIKVIATGSSGNCYLLETENESLLIECGISIKKIKEALNFNLTKVKGCLITHEHKDHSKCVNDIMKTGIDVYMSSGTSESCELIQEFKNYRLHLLESSKQYNIGSFRIVPFETQHDCKEPQGFLIYHPELGKILFATDTYYLKYRFENVDHILIECNYTEDVIPALPVWRARTIKSHMSLETLKDTLNAWNLENTKDITLIHISNDNGDPDRFQKEIEKLTGVKTYIAASGLEIK